jgi:hypothetical protein
MTELEYKRLYGLDFIRGGGIVGMVIIHAFAFGVFTPDPAIYNEFVEKVPFIVIVLLSPLVIFSSWFTLFIFVAGATTAYTMVAQFHKNPKRNDFIYISKIINVMLLFFFSYVSRLILSPPYYHQGTIYYSMLTGSIRQNEFQFIETSRLYIPSTLAVIAYSILIVSTIMYFGLKIMDKRDIKTTKLLEYILAVVFILWILISLALDIINEYTGIYNTIATEPNPVNFTLARLMGYRNSIFPVTMFGIFGALIGVLLAEGKTDKVKKISYPTGFFFIIVVILYIASINFEVGHIFVSEKHPFFFQLGNLGLTILLSAWFMERMDFYEKESIFSKPERTLWVRRFGFVSLSVYLLEGVIVAIFYRIFVSIFGLEIFPWNPIAALAFVVLSLLFWVVVLPLWEKKEFKYSFEWIAVNIHQIIRSSTSKLKIRESLYER